MSTPVNTPGADGRRPYDSSRRRENARVMRAEIVAATHELLEERGYVATTIAEIGRRAGVSTESVFKAFGTKAALVKAAFDVAIAGDDDNVAIADRPEIRRIIEQPDVPTKLRLYFEGGAVRLHRSARIQLAVRTGAAENPVIAELWQSIQRERLVGTGRFAEHLLATGRLRTAVDVNQVRDVIWTTTSVEMYDLLVLQRSWTTAAFVDWSQSTLNAFLRGDG